MCETEVVFAEGCFEVVKVVETDSCFADKYIYYTLYIGKHFADEAVAIDICKKLAEKAKEIKDGK